MPVAPLQLPHMTPAPSFPERRLHRRFELSLAGRFMRDTKAEHPCRVLDASVSALSLGVEADLASSMHVDEHIIAYIDQLGGLEGRVQRTTQGAFILKLNASTHKREKLAAQITWLINEPDMKGAAQRQHERIPVGHRSAILKIGEGVFIDCLVLDVSLSGASIACSGRPDVGGEVWLGRLRARVMRHHAEGLGLQFMEVLTPEDLRTYFS
jgi:PilZ domain